MTASEVRDRLDQRFRLLVGSRRGLERHHTLRHAVAWSYDHLDDAEKSLLERCSVFGGGFDLQSACAAAGSDDDYAVLDLLDALVRKSLLVAASRNRRSISRPLFSGDNPARRRRVVVWPESKVNKPSGTAGPCTTISVDGDDDGDVSPDLLKQEACVIQDVEDRPRCGAALLSRPDQWPVLAGASGVALDMSGPVE